MGWFQKTKSTADRLKDLERTQGHLVRGLRYLLRESIKDMAKWADVDRELAEMDADITAILKMVDDLTAIVKGAGDDAVKLSEVEGKLDEMGKRLEAKLAPKDDGASTGDVQS